MTKIVIDRAVVEGALSDVCAARLCEVNSMSSRQEMLRLMIRATDALRAALAQQPEPVQEPVHQFRLMYSSDWHDGHPNPAYGYGPYQTRTLYAAPPQRPRLTDEEIDALPWNGSPRQFARAIERKVRGE